MSTLLRASARTFSVAVAAVAVLAAACDEAPSSDGLSSAAVTAPSLARGGPGAVEVGTSFDFPSGAVYDIEALPNGDILVPVSVQAGLHPSGGEVTTTIREIRTGGEGGVRDYATVSTPAAGGGAGVPVNGLASVGRGSVYLTRGGLDLAVGAAVGHLTRSGEEIVGDIHAFEVANDPDAAVWKVPACEGAGMFSAGPQSNPYHLAAETGNTMIVGDAAGNQVLRVKSNGEIEVVAVVTPPVDGGGFSTDPADWRVAFSLGEIDCYVQPVPNTVAVGPDGAIYVGELTGSGPTGFPPLGASRVWRIEPGTKETVCPSDDCEMILDGFTSIIDLELGPGGDLYVVEYDENGWLWAFFGVPQEAGTVDRCPFPLTGTDASTACAPAVFGEETLEELPYPSAIAFDKWGRGWLLENNVGPVMLSGSPPATVRLLGQPD